MEASWSTLAIFNAKEYYTAAHVDVLKPDIEDLTDRVTANLMSNMFKTKEELIEDIRSYYKTPNMIFLKCLVSIKNKAVLRAKYTKDLSKPFKTLRGS